MSTDLDFTLDGESAADIGFQTRDFPAPLIPPQEQRLIELSGMPGAEQDSKKFKSYELPIEGILIADSPEELTEAIENLKYFLYSDVDKKLIKSIQSDRYYNVQYLDDIVPPREATTLDLLLKFTCNDPLAYAVIEDDQDEIGIAVNGHQWDVVNGGRLFVWPTITITFNQPQTHIYIKNNSIVDCTFNISKAFNTNDVLVIDCKEISIYLNGVYSPAGIGDGGDGMAIPIILKASTNQIEIGTDDATINLDVNFTYRKLYL